MRNVAFEPCIPTRGTKVPTGPDWIHEIKAGRALTNDTSNGTKFAADRVNVTRA
jgi:hypothetical protein